MKPSPQDPHHVTLHLIQQITSDAMQAKEQAERERDKARSLEIELSSLKHDHKVMASRMRTLEIFVIETAQARSVAGSKARALKESMGLDE